MSDNLTEAFLKHYWTLHPVDATFIGAPGYDRLLPPAEADTLAKELAGIAALQTRLDAAAEPKDLGDHLDQRLIRNELIIQKAAAETRPRLHNPAFYSGEAAFGIVSLLLPQSAPVREDALFARLTGIPAFLSAGLEQLARRAVPQVWTQRAQREAKAMAQFLRGDIALHEAYTKAWTEPAAVAADAFDNFARGLGGHADADPACGEDYLTLLMHDVHALELTPRQALDQAEAAFDRMGVEMDEMAKAIDPERSADEILAALADEHPRDADGVMALYKRLDKEALDAAAGLVTPARDYSLTYRWMAPCFVKLSQVLYFLFYRSPPALNPGGGSTYWVTPSSGDEQAFLRANNVAMVKTIHAVHHGSIGHHTQNARARPSPSRLARLAGTDCALGLAFLGSGTLIEGWACYVEDLLMEAPGFYSPAEVLLLKQFERRNAASVLVDINLHLGRWSLDECMAFYRDKAGFAAARVESEVVRNSMLPGSRLMYWLGVEGIKSLRKRWTGTTLDFHDALLSYGHVPLAWIEYEMQRAGQIQ